MSVNHEIVKSLQDGVVIARGDTVADCSRLKIWERVDVRTLSGLQSTNLFSE